MQDSGAQFRLLTEHGTTLSATGADGALAHAQEPPPEAVIVGRLLREGRAVLARADGAPFLVPHPEQPSPARLLPVFIEQHPEGRSAVRIDGSRPLTALPTGEVVANRWAIGGWELFSPQPLSVPVETLARLPEPNAEQLLAGAPGEQDEMTLTLALMRLEAEELRRLVPRLRSRSDYPRLFPWVQAVISDGQGRSGWNTRRRMATEIERYGWSIGDHTYGHPGIVDGEYGHFEIGRYCSMAGGVTIILSNHVTDTATTYPFAALRSFWPSAPTEVADHDSKGGVFVGSSVWLGMSSTILHGTRIGHGAIVGAGAVVAGEIPPPTQ